MSCKPKQKIFAMGEVFQETEQVVLFLLQPRIVSSIGFGIGLEPLLGISAFRDDELLVQGGVAVFGEQRVLAQAIRTSSIKQAE